MLKKGRIESKRKEEKEEEKGRERGRLITDCKLVLMASIIQFMENKSAIAMVNSMNRNMNMNMIKDEKNIINRRSTEETKQNADM